LARPQIKSEPLEIAAQEAGASDDADKDLKKQVGNLYKHVLIVWAGVDRKA